MPALKQIKLPDVKLFQNMSAAPIGTLLQVENGPPNAQVCLRAELTVSNGISQGVVLLEGAHAGLFMTAEELNYGPAYDLTNLAEIVLNNPAAKATGITPLPRGSIFQVSDRDDKLFFAMSVCLSQSTTIEGYVRLTAPDCGKIVKAANPLCLGTAMVIESNKSA